MAIDLVHPGWLFQHDCAFYDAWGQRMDTAELPRWSAPALAKLRAANHAAAGPDSPLIPDQLLQVFDAQHADGARRKCIDLYGDLNDRDRMLGKFGLKREIEHDILVMIWSRSKTRLPAFPAQGDRPAPPVVEIEREDWYDSVIQTRKDGVRDWEHDVIRHQASIEPARFYGIRIGDVAVACGARYDLNSASRVDSLHVDEDFRGTGFGRAVLARAIREASAERIYGTFDEANFAIAAIGERLGGAVALRDVYRRYVGKWEDHT
ncbi:MAG: GNAT superfamily N-acetyltransferase [Bradymonadia bacterium]|jgi:GNAT superfamily N-acetyltransferase